MPRSPGREDRTGLKEISWKRLVRIACRANAVTGIHDLGDDVVRKINKAVLVPDDEARIGNGERSYAINRKRPRMPGPSIAFAS
jgi:hypothetical protein